jgi:hypothetical protein
MPFGGVVIETGSGLKDGVRKYVHMNTTCNLDFKSFEIRESGLCAMPRKRQPKDEPDKVVER